MGSPDGQGARIDVPGAASATQLPVLENEARLPEAVLAPTAMASGTAAGYSTGLPVW